jgi:hypothetical protein
MEETVFLGKYPHRLQVLKVVYLLLVSNWILEYIW